MGKQQTTIRFVRRAADLPLVRSVIRSAVNAWPAPERLKRCALPVLMYDEQDLDDFELLLLTKDGSPLAVGAWQPQAALDDPDGRISTLLHGLYVAESAQRNGFGTELQSVISRRAAAAGFNGLHVKAERFAVTYFARCGYRRLASAEQPRNAPAYPYWFWQPCATIRAASLTHYATIPDLEGRS